MPFEPKGNQAQAIDARGRILVSAAAGSGKTTVLSHRVVKRIMDPVDPVDVNDLLIVTFTNAAAAEMRQRISGVLSEYIATHTDNLRALRQKADLDTAAIGTIDSFCIDLVRENFEAAGVRPDYRIMSNERLTVLCDRAARDTLNDLLVNDPAAFRQMTASLWKDGSYDAAVDGIIALYRYAQVMPYPFVWLERVVRDYGNDLSFNDLVWTKTLLSGTFDKADYALNQIQYAQSVIAGDPALQDKLSERFREAASGLLHVREAARACDYEAVRAALAVVPPIGFRDFPRNTDPALKESIFAARDAAYKRIDGEKKRYLHSADEQLALMRAAGSAVATLCRCVIAFAERLHARMREENSYDFNAIEHAALDLLCDCVEGKPVPKEGEWNHRYREVMVDEYQDTNDLQDAIFYALSDCGRNLFLVGDVKQSIYRFRRANPANFIAKRHALALYADGADSGRIALSGNFRSRPDVCDYVNHTFRLLMTEKAADMDYEREDELIPMREDYTPFNDPAVALHLVATPSDSVEEEARYVAAALLKAREEGMTVSDGNGGLRPMSWGDVIILTRTVKGSKMTARCFVEALQRVGIPADADTREDLKSCEEVRMLLSLLRAIDNPLRDVSLLAAMMSPMFAFTPDEVARIRLCSRSASLFAALKKDADSQPKSAAFLNRLDRYRRWAGTLPADRLIRRIIDDVGLSAIAYRMENGAHANANLMLFVDYAAQYEAEGYRGLTSFLRFWDRVVKQVNDIPCAATQPGGDAVRVLSIHGSKGLEAPVVILADTAKRINHDNAGDGMIFDETLGVSTKYYDDANAVEYETFAHSVAIEKSNRDANAEELRLLYVAMTRARDRLWLIVRAKDPADALNKSAAKLSSGWESREDPIDPLVVSSSSSVSDWLLATALLHPDAKALRDLSGRMVSPTSSAGRLRIVIGAAPAADDLTPAEIVQEEMDFSPYLDYVYPYEDILRFEAKYSVSQLAKSDLHSVNSCVSRPAFITGDRLTPAERGTATHRFMCFADYERARMSVKDEIDRLVTEGRLTRVQGDGIDVATVEAFFGSDLFRRVQSSDRVLRECRFLCEMPVRRLDPSCDSDEAVVVQGVADLVLIEPDGVTIVDFKTDRNCTAGELCERYARQLAIYADAFSIDYHLPKKTPYLYSFFLREAVEVPGIATESEKM